MASETDLGTSLNRDFVMTTADRGLPRAPRSSARARVRRSPAEQLERMKAHHTTTTGARWCVPRILTSVPTLVMNVTVLRICNADIFSLLLSLLQATTLSLERNPIYNYYVLMYNVSVLHLRLINRKWKVCVVFGFMTTITYWQRCIMV